MTGAIVDPDAVAYNFRIVIASVSTVFFVSATSYILRIIARKKVGLKLQADDWIMGLAFPFSWIPAACVLYGAFGTLSSW